MRVRQGAAAPHLDVPCADSSVAHLDVHGKCIECLGPGSVADNAAHHKQGRRAGSMVFFRGRTTRTRHINRIEHRPDVGRIATPADRDKNGERQTVPTDAYMDFAGDAPA